jgi:signal transduction histidine kinase
MPWAEVAADVILVAFACLAGWGVRSHEETLSVRRQLAVEAEAHRAADERLAMAGALHDHLGGALSLAARQLEAAGIVGGDQRERLIGSAREHLRATLDQVAALVSSWSHERKGEDRQAPSTLPAGTTQARRALAWWLAALSPLGIDLSVTTKGDWSVLGTSIDDVLAALAAEALGNVARHSAGKSVNLALEIRSSSVRFSVHDPGPMRDGPGAGTGLARLRRRVEGLGGSFVAGPDEGNGFCLEARLPVAVTKDEVAR